MIYQYSGNQSGSPLLFGLSQVNILELAKKQNGNPFFIYDLAIIKNRFNKLKGAINNSKLKIHYALKANNNPQVLKLFRELNAGVDVVSGGEIDLSLKAGFLPSQIIFSGIAKSEAELTKAINLKIKQINIESESEFLRIGKLSKKLNKKINVAFRVNPEVNPITHPYITTGFRENKFGIDAVSLRIILDKIKDFPQINLCGLTMHIGSQLQNLESLKEALEKQLLLSCELKSQGHTLSRIDIGGGVGVYYDTDDFIKDDSLIDNYAEIIKMIPQDQFDEIIIEPGRSLVAKSGALITQIEYIKSNGYKNFLITNSGMNHLVRPALYQAMHRIYPVQLFPERGNVLYDVVGPICESSDFLGKDRWMQQGQEGEFLAIADSGAYGFTMSNTYNVREQAPEICV